MATSAISKTHAHPLAAFLFPSLAVACFMAWVIVGFIPSIGFPFPHVCTPVAPRANFSWVLGIVSMIASMAAIASFGKSRTKPAPSRPHMDSFKKEMTRNARVQSVCAACMMTIGTIPFILTADHNMFIILGGILCGLGAPFMMLAWFSAAVRHTPTSSLWIASLSALFTLILTCTCAVLNPVSVGFICMCLPILACIFTWISIQQCASFETHAADINIENPQSASLFDTWGLMLLASVLIAFLATSTIGSSSVLETISVPWFSMLAAGASAIIIIAIVHVMKNGAYQRGIMIATILSVIITALSAITGNVALVSACGINAFLLVCTGLMMHFTNMRDIEKFNTPAFNTHCASFSTWIIFAIIVGCLGGDFLRMNDSIQITHIALIISAIVYAIVMVLFMCSTNKTLKSRVLHKKFDTPQQAARARCDVLTQSYTDISKREADIITYMLLSFEEDTIASELAISPRTVHSHIERIYAKMGISTRKEFDEIANKITIK